MRSLLHIFVILSILAGLLAGCHDTPHYDQRLMKADSLLQNIHDSHLALEQLNGLQRNSLSGEGNKAYYDLLLTQARYKCYIKATSDSNINRALKYYTQHSDEQDKLLRAYIYKGAVMEELGKPDSAMTMYKQAETVILPTDYFNQGYVKMRMGDLYNQHHAYGGRNIEKLEQALERFRRAQDTHYQIVCLKDLGAMYRGTNTDKAEEKLNEAIALATSANDTNNLINSRNNLAYLYFMMGQKDKTYYSKAYKELQHIKRFRLKGLPENVYTTFACVYANLGMPDSALWYLQLAQVGTDRDSSYFQSNNYLEPMSQIAKARGDSLNYLKLSYRSDRNSFSSLSDSNIVNIMYAENDFDHELSRKQAQEQRKARNTLIAVISAVILSLLALALLFYRRAHRYDRLIVELKDQSQSQMNDLSDLQGNISEMKINDERLKGFISSHMGMMREMIEACYHEPNNRIAENMKRIVKFQDSNKDNWVKLYDYIDMEHNNIMTHTRNTYPQLNDRDLLLLALTSMGFSYIQTAIIMGYSNATSVSVIKQRLAQKMGLDCSLNEYIKRYGNSDTSPKRKKSPQKHPKNEVIENVLEKKQ